MRLLLLNNRTSVMIHWVALLIMVIFSGPSVEASDQPIVILQSSEIEVYSLAAKGVGEVLKDGKALTYTLAGDPNRIPHVMEKIALVSPRLVIAIGSLATLALKMEPIHVPVVFCLVVNHSEALQMERSWAISMHLPAEEAYRRINEVLPRSRIGIPYDSERTGELVGSLLNYFKGKSIQLIPVPVKSPAGLSTALIQARSKIDALWILPDASFLDPASAKFLLRYSVSESLPLLGYSEGFSKNGALMSMVGDYREMGRQAAETAEQILSGEDPSKVKFPRGIRTYINIQVAKRLNIPVGRSLILLAERIYP
jgi:putative ABC transport system substrate-binding protein